VDSVDVRCPDVRKFPHEMLDSLKKRYADEVNEKIRKNIRSDLLI